VKAGKGNQILHLPLRAKYKLVRARSYAPRHFSLPALVKTVGYELTVGQFFSLVLLAFSFLLPLAIYI